MPPIIPEMREITRQVPADAFDAEYIIGEVCMEVDHLTSSNPQLFNDISFELHRGEILGIAGLAGSHSHEFVESILGNSLKSSGSIYVTGKNKLNTPSGNTLNNNYSESDRQKIILSSWFTISSDILVINEPTKGIEAGSENEIYAIMAKLAKQGKAIIMITDKTSELTAMSHRLLVICGGKLKATLDRENINRETIMRYAKQSGNL
ncbi:MAG: hypothetical protein FWB89_01920 [Treponema sp.]|nr:hypothetical protein [Treponema sp.]